MLTKIYVDNKLVKNDIFLKGKINFQFHLPFLKLKDGGQMVGSKSIQLSLKFLTRIMWNHQNQLD